MSENGHSASAASENTNVSGVPVKVLSGTHTFELDVDTLLPENMPPTAIETSGGHSLSRAVSAEEPSLYDPLSALKLLEDNSAEREKILQPTFRKPVVLEFKDLRFAVDDKEIVRGVSGSAAPGHVMAIMGPSGAGKTSLLDLLAGRITVSQSRRSISGAILINGKKRNYDEFRKQSAYVLQSDNFFAELTVKETITLSAMLRLPRDMPDEAKHARVAQLINELGLGKCQHSLVGNDLVRGVSGGERKRVNIAMELVTDPSLVFLDEPTSGLDSFNAQSVMQLLLKLARNNRTIVTTIHQPRSSIYQMFDTLMLVSDGRAMYFGPASFATEYFARQGFPCPDTYNPADFFMDLLALDTRTPKLTRVSRARINKLAASYASVERGEVPSIAEQAAASGLARSTDALAVPSTHTSTRDSPRNTLTGAAGASLEAGRSSNYATSWFYQFGRLCWRSFRSITREKDNNIALLGQTIVFALLIGCIWLNAAGPVSGKRIQSIAGYLYFVVINQAFSGMFGILFLFPSERVVVLKERGSRMYQIGAYFWSKTVTELPRNLIVNMIFSLITYFMVGLRGGGDHFFVYYVFTVLSMMSSEGLAYVVGAIARDPQQGGAIAPAFIVMAMLFGGFFIGANSMPVWLAWIRHLSFIKYAFAGLMQNEYEGRILATSACTSGFCPATGDGVLSFYSLDEVPFWANFIIMLVMIVGLRLIAYALLRRGGPKFDHTL